MEFLRARTFLFSLSFSLSLSRARGNARHDVIGDRGQVGAFDKPSRALWKPRTIPGQRERQDKGGSRRLSRNRGERVILQKGGKKSCRDSSRDEIIGLNWNPERGRPRVPAVPHRLAPFPHPFPSPFSSFSGILRFLFVRQAYLAHEFYSTRRDYCLSVFRGRFLQWPEVHGLLLLFFKGWQEKLCPRWESSKLLPVLPVEVITTLLRETNGY